MLLVACYLLYQTWSISVDEVNDRKELCRSLFALSLFATILGFIIPLTSYGTGEQFICQSLAYILFVSVMIWTLFKKPLTHLCMVGDSDAELRKIGQSIENHAKHNSQTDIRYTGDSAFSSVGVSFTETTGVEMGKFSSGGNFATGPVRDDEFSDDDFDSRLSNAASRHHTKRHTENVTLSDQFSRTTVDSFPDFEDVGTFATNATQQFGGGGSMSAIPEANTTAYYGNEADQRKKRKKKRRQEEASKLRQEDTVTKPEPRMTNMADDLEKDSLATGDTVRVFGLTDTAAQQFNGRVGTITGRTKQGRFKVRISGVANLTIKPSNVQKLADEPVMYTSSTNQIRHSMAVSIHSGHTTNSMPQIAEASSKAHRQLSKIREGSRVRVLASKLHGCEGVIVNKVKGEVGSRLR